MSANFLAELSPPQNGSCRYQRPKAAFRHRQAHSARQFWRAITFAGHHGNDDIAYSPISVGCLLFV